MGTVPRASSAIPTRWLAGLRGSRTQLLLFSDAPQNQPRDVRQLNMVDFPPRRNLLSC